jgi:cell filamentation protein
VSQHDDPYVIPGTNVLRNRLGITDARKLDRTERRLVGDRIAEGVPDGSFDLAHLRAIHRHLFQDVYDWAGELRTVEISKGGSQFQFRQYIPTGMADVHRRLGRAGFLKHRSPREFAREAGTIMGDINYIHPFRKGTAGRKPNTSSNWLRRQATPSTCAASIRPSGSRLRRRAMRPTTR